MPMRRLAHTLHAGMLLACSACAPVIVWRGTTPDARVGIEVRQRGTHQYVVFDGRAGPPFESIAIDRLQATADGRIAYPARTGGRWIVMGGDTAVAWDGIGELAFGAAGQLVYAAEADGRWCVVRDGRRGPSFDGILQGSLQFGVGGRVAYAGRGPDGVHPVLDDSVFSPYDAVASLRFDPAGEQLAFAGRRGDLWTLHAGDWRSHPYELIAEYRWHEPHSPPAVIGRKQGGWWVSIGGSVFGPYQAAGPISIAEQGGRWAFVAREGGQDYVVTQSWLSPPYARVLPTSLTQSATGDRLGFIIRTPGGEAAVVDGDMGPLYQEVRGLAFTPDGSRSAYSARAADGERVVLDGMAGAAFEAVTDLTLGRSGRLAFIARSGGTATVTVDGAQHPFDAAVEGSLVFSDDEVHWAVLAGSRRDRKLRVVVDSRPGVEFDWQEFAASVLFLPPERFEREGTRRLQEWMRAQLRLALEGWWAAPKGR